MLGAMAMFVGGAGGPASDPYFANVTSLLHMDGADASTTFTDQKGVAYTARNGARLSTANAKFGTAAADLLAGGRYLLSASNAGFGAGTADFTIEAWVKIPVLSATHTIFDATARGTSAGFLLSMSGSGSLVLGGGTSSAAGAYSAGSYSHIAASRQSNTLRVFVDGSPVISTSNATNYAATAITIGSVYDGSGNPILGYVDEFRFTKGVARYTAAFAPPTSAFPDN